MLQFVNDVGTPLPPRSFDHDSEVTATLSFAVPASATVGSAVTSPLTGELIVSTGAVLSRNTSSVVVVAWPNASRAVKVRVLGPGASGMFALHDDVPVAVPVPPRWLLHVTWVTAWSSSAVPLTGRVASGVRAGVPVGLAIA